MKHSPWMRQTALTVLVLAAVLAADRAAAKFPFPLPAGGATQAQKDDYSSYLFIRNGDCSSGSNAGTDLPANFNCQNFKDTDWREPPGFTTTYDPTVANNPQELYGVRGPGTNKAFMVSTGRPDVLISVLDSGIEWQNLGDIYSVVNKLYLNRGELPKPCLAGQSAPCPGNSSDTRFGGYDVNGDGVFNIQDYANDAGVSDLNGNGILDPEDLIFAFSDGTDADNNGYVDDISGWDFFENDNDPRDEVVYGHGTGEAKDSSAEAERDDPQCPNCMVIPLRVGDSFVADVNHFAEAVVYSVDMGVKVVQEAEGDVNHTSFGQAAIDYAYAHGVIVNASEADENASHHMWPAAYDKTMVVNSVHAANTLFDQEQAAVKPYSWLYFNACTNFGVYTYVSISSNSCSSEATGRSAGISGLMQAAAKNAVERGQMTNYIDDNGDEQPANVGPVSAEELRQLWRLGADDIDFASPCIEGVGPQAHCKDAPAGAVAFAPPDNYVTTIPTATRYSTVKGWDFFTGYGRANNGRTLRFIGLQGIPGVPDQIEGPATLTAQDRIPPEAFIESPRWFRQYGYDAEGQLLIPDDPLMKGQMVISGHAAANRVTKAGGTFDYVLEWAPQVQGPDYLSSGGADTSAEGSEDRTDGPWTVIGHREGLRHALEGELGRVDISAIVTGQMGSSNPFNLVTDPTSPFLPESQNIRLRLRVIAHPANAADTINNEAITMKQVDVYPAAETVMRDDLGLHGKPSDGGASPSFHDIDGDGKDELIVASGDGLVHAYTDVARGLELPGWPVHTAPLAMTGLHGTVNGGDVSYGDIHDTGNNAYTRFDADHASPHGVESRYYSPILIGTPAVADLDDDGKAEVLVSDNEGRVYAWEPDGALRAGFPVTVNYDWTTPLRCTAARGAACDAHVPNPKRDRVNRKDWGIISGVTLGDLDPAHPGLEIAAGCSDGHIYVWHEDGTPVNGWPVMLRDPAKVASVDPSTHLIKFSDDGNTAYDVAILPNPALADLDGDGKLEIVSGVDEEYIEDPNVAIDPAVSAASALLGSSGNNRVYALYQDGNHHAGTKPPNQPDAVAYLQGWPVKPAMLLTELLPTVGSGTNTQPVIFSAANGEPRIAVSSCCGPVYIFKPDGTSAVPPYRVNGKDIPLADTVFGAASTAIDRPAIAGVGALAVGSLDGGLHMTVVGPGTGLRRALSIAAIDEHAVGAEDQLSMWDTRTGQHEPNSPIQVNDLQFFIAPIVADIDGKGLASAIQSTAVGDTVAAGLLSTEFTATRYHTGGWIVASAAVGSGPVLGADGKPDNQFYMTTITREGYLRLYPTPVAMDGSANCKALAQWPEKGHDAFRSGNYATDGERPYPVRTLTAALHSGDPKKVDLKFLASGDDRDCGQAKTYKVRLASSAMTAWSAATALPDLAGGVDPGTQLSYATGALADGAHWLLVRAYDDAGNGSAIRSVKITTGTVTPPPTEFPATILGSLAQVDGTAGSTLDAGGFTIRNDASEDEELDSLTLRVEHPELIASATLTVGARSATVDHPGANAVFNFNPAVTLPAGSTVATLKVTLAGGSTASAAPSLLSTAHGADGAAGGRMSLLALALLLMTALLLPRRWAFPLVAALALLAGCSQRSAHLGAGSGGGTGAETAAFTVQSAAAHTADGSVTFSGLPLRFAEVTRD